MDIILDYSGITSSLVLIGLWLFRKWIIIRLTADVQLENDGKLAEIKSDLEETREILNSVRSAGDNAYSQSQAALLPHKINAIGAVWGSVLAWNRMQTASMFVSALTIDWVEKHGSDSTTKETIEVLIGHDHLDFMRKQNDIELYRPFISERGWALYSAFNSFYVSRLARAAILTIPLVGHAEVWKSINERTLVKAAAPKEILELYDLSSGKGGNSFLEYLKDEMIAEFKLELSSTRDSECAVKNATVIQQAADKLKQNSIPEQDKLGDIPLDLLASVNQIT